MRKLLILVASMAMVLGMLVGPALALPPDHANNSDTAPEVNFGECIRAAGTPKAHGNPNEAGFVGPLTGNSPGAPGEQGVGTRGNYPDRVPFTSLIACNLSPPT